MYECGGSECVIQKVCRCVCDTITPVYEQCLDSKCAKFCWCQMSACECVRLSLCEALSGEERDLVRN